VPKKPETLFKERIRPLLDNIPRSWWFKTQQLSTLGIPDFIGCVGGKFVAIELKRDKKEALKSHALQRHILQSIVKAGGYATFMYPENQLEIIEKIKRL
tara:strand:- start:105 stop:401 length:297 start_codon:yes stop_codon:yes gene_type:complete